MIGVDTVLNSACGPSSGYLFISSASALTDLNSEYDGIILLLVTALLQTVENKGSLA